MTRWKRKGGGRERGVERRGRPLIVQPNCRVRTFIQETMGKPNLEGVTLFPMGHTDRLDARTAAANPFGYRSSSPSAFAASKSSTRARRTDVFGPAERLPDARRRATRARRARRPRAARAHRPSSPRCAVESSRLPRPPRAAFFFPRAGVSVPSSARAVLSRAVCCCRHDG